MTLTATMLGTGYAMATRCYNTCFVLTEDGEATDGTTHGGEAPSAAASGAASAPVRELSAEATGAASVPTPDHPSKPRRLLVDGGGGNDILNQLERAHIDIGSIGQIFVTHKHMDHLLGMLWVVRAITHRMHFDGDAREVTLYAHDEVLQLLQELCDQMLVAGQRRYLGTRLHFVELHDGDTYVVAGHPTTFFDMQSPKAKQFGFSMRLDAADAVDSLAASPTPSPVSDVDGRASDAVISPTANPSGRRLVCLGDEPFHPADEPYVQDAAWLMHEAFCLAGDEGTFHPRAKGHTTALDAARIAEAHHVENLVLYHTEDTDLTHRRERFTAEARQAFSGTVYVPDDLESFEIR